MVVSMFLAAFLTTTKEYKYPRIAWVALLALIAATALIVYILAEHGDKVQWMYQS